MAKVLILGAAGRLGASLARDYGADHEVVAWGRSEADLAQPGHVAELVKDSAPDVVINCAAMTNVDECETQRAKAQTVNAEAPGAVARAATGLGARLIHISTDYVFSGEKREPYNEEDQPGPVSWYGETKWAGEQAVMAAGPRHAVVRVSWVFGPDRDSFIDKALQTALRGEPVRAVADKWSSPSYTADIGAALRALMSTAAPGGIYHVCNSGVCTWLDWAAHAIAVAGQIGMLAQEIKVEPLRLADLAAMVARRPVHSGMNCRRIEALIGQAMRPWQDAVADYVRSRYSKRS